MPSLTFYGGVGEVGGNKILLKDDDTRILLDFGLSFNLKRQYYVEPFLTPKSEKSLLELGLLPRLEGAYAFDKSEAEINAVFLSHSHMDHVAYVSLLKKEIPIYCGETTATILKALSDIRPTSLEYDFKSVKLNVFRTGGKITVGDLEVEPVHVDHSVPGAYGYIIHSSTGAVVYTGDFRLHGTKPEMTEDFIHRATEAKPVAMVTEATNMVGFELSTESEVREKTDRVVKDTSQIVLTYFATADIDRLNSFFTVAKKNRRCLALTLRQAYLLEKLKKDLKLEVPDLKNENVLIFQKRKKRYQTWEEKLLNEANVVDALKVSKIQNQLILLSPFYELEELMEINPNPGSCYLYSASEPANEEAEIDMDKLTNWLNHYGLPQYHIHVSGHIMPLQLRETLKKVKPKKIYPIHCERPELFSRFIKDLESQIILAEKNREYVM